MVLGITGGICTGKTTAAEVVTAQGVRIIDCDEVSHYLTRYDETVLSEIKARYGGKVFFPHGALNRSGLAAVVFTSEAERLALESILHPRIIEVVRRNIRYANDVKEPIVVVAPLMIEAGMQDEVDHLWVISCTAEIQIERLMNRSGQPRESAQNWINAQMSMEEKEKFADTIIRNNGSLDEFKAAVRLEWDKFIHIGSSIS